jgi:alkanesulfonate monooxygenase SsuD/methylene tetrahydromethanopterin reductase-like flavin-dependent oxidoreductase (luciferase family)
VLAPLHHPLRLAEDAATVDLLSGGRLVLGLGLGWRAEEFEALGIEQRGLGRRLEEIIETLRQAWSDGLVDIGVPEPGVAVTPKPAQPAGPPIWIGGSAERAVRRAARLADGYLASRIPLDAFAQRCGWLREELERSSRDPSGFGIGISIMCFPWPDPEEGWRLVRDHAHYVLWKYTDMAGARARTGPPPRAPPLTPDGEQQLHASTFVGTPEQVAEHVRAYAEAAGDDFHFVARSYFPGLDPQVQREILHLLAEDVAPLLR